MPPSPPLYVVGLDLGQARDPSALAVLEQTRPAPSAEASYGVRELRRWPLGTSYVDIVAEVVKLCGTAPLAGCSLVIDGTGCGRAVVDQFRYSTISAGAYPVLITAGNSVSRDEHGYYHVAKIQLVSTMQVLLGTRRMRFVRLHPLTATLERELSTFTAKITNAGNETFAADWRAGAHDDLVLAVALAAWFGENVAIGFPTSQGGVKSVFDGGPGSVFDGEPGSVFDGEDRGDDDEERGITWPWQ